MWEFHLRTSLLVASDESRPRLRIDGCPGADPCCECILAGIRQMSAPSRRPSSSIDQESVEKCEVVHTSEKIFPPDRGTGERLYGFPSPQDIWPSVQPLRVGSVPFLNLPNALHHGATRLARVMGAAGGSAVDAGPPGSRSVMLIACAGAYGRAAAPSLDMPERQQGLSTYRAGPRICLLSPSRVGPSNGAAARAKLIGRCADSTGAPWHHRCLGFAVVRYL